MDALLVMHQDEPLPPLCNGETYPECARLGLGSMGQTVKVSLAVAHTNKRLGSKAGKSSSTFPAVSAKTVDFRQKGVLQALQSRGSAKGD